MKRRMFKAREGFTLIEVATSVVIVAVLTAAVVPVIVKQIDNAEPTRVANDLNSISKGIETFHMNLRPTYPSDLYQLTTIIDGDNASSVDMSGEEYLEKHETAWLGPYVNSNVPSLNTTLTTGFGGLIDTRLYWVNSNLPLTSDNSTNNKVGGSTPLANADFIAVKLTNITAGEFDKLDLVLDGTVSSTAGRLRYVLDNSSNVHAYFFAVPYSK